MNPGEVVWVDLPSGAGRAQAGRRPAVVVQAPEPSRLLPTVLVVPLTTQQDALRFPGTIYVAVDPQNGLKKPSVALVFQLTAIDQVFIGAAIGRITDALLQSMWAALDELMGRASASP